MIQRLIDGLKQKGGSTTEHLPFYFTRSFHKARKASPAKVMELFKVLGRLCRLRIRGPIDLLVYTPGGPQKVPLIRDLLLLPFLLAVSRKTVLHFHAGGIGDLLEGRASWLARSAAWLYSRAAAAVVMTAFNKRDPERCGIREIKVIPHRIQDVSRFQPAVERPVSHPHFLYVGNLHDDKGTSLLISAFARLLEVFPQAELDLAGEFHPPYSREKFNEEAGSLVPGGQVRYLGKIDGTEKEKAFARADCLVFPTIAPSESFGLVLVEAMMWGLPVISSDWRGNRDVLSGSPGAVLFSPPDSQTALYEALFSFSKRKDDWEMMGNANRIVFENFYRSQGAWGPLEDYLVTLAHRSKDGER